MAYGPVNWWDEYEAKRRFNKASSLREQWLVLDDYNRMTQHDPWYEWNQDAEMRTLYDAAYSLGQRGVTADPSPSLTPEQREEWVTGYCDGLGDGGRESTAESIAEFYGRG